MIRAKKLKWRRSCGKQHSAPLTTGIGYSVHRGYEGQRIALAHFGATEHEVGWHKTVNAAKAACQAHADALAREIAEVDQ